MSAPLNSTTTSAAPGPTDHSTLRDGASRSSQSDTEAKHPHMNVDVERELEKGHPDTAAALAHEIETDNEHVRALPPLAALRCDRRPQQRRIARQGVAVGFWSSVRKAWAPRLTPCSTRAVPPSQVEQNKYMRHMTWAKIRFVALPLLAALIIAWWASSVWNTKTRHRCVFWQLSPCTPSSG